MSLIILPSLTCGVLDAWSELEDYELEKENYKTTYRKIERATIGFSFGLIYGAGLTLFSSVIIPGASIAFLHSHFKK
jgi:hypothetical protein